MQQVFIKGRGTKPHDVFFTSDLHFGHANVIKYCNRPTTAEEQDEWLISQINSVVPQNAIVYHLGDFSLKRDKEYLTSIMKRLNGTWHVVLGNHDVKPALSHAASESDNIVLGWYWSERFYKDQSCKDIYADIKMMHFPIESWDCKHRGAIHLHGHLHGGTSNGAVQKLNNRLDVGLDAQGNHVAFCLQDIVEKLLTESTTHCTINDTTNI